jgi:glycerol-3-phosphate responsive antiterminator
MRGEECGVVVGISMLAVATEQAGVNKLLDAVGILAQQARRIQMIEQRERIHLRPVSQLFWLESHAVRQSVNQSGHEIQPALVSTIPATATVVAMPRLPNR